MSANSYVDTDNVRSYPERFKAVMMRRTKVIIAEHSLQNNKEYVALLREDIDASVYYHRVSVNYLDTKYKLEQGLAKGFIDSEIYDKAISAVKRNKDFFIGKVVSNNG